jgi:hypothetical protein
MTWHLQCDNPDFLGWSVVAVYLAAAGSCAWMALKVSEGRGIWWLLAAGLLFLGINKQLNLQSLMIDLGRQAAQAGGWYGRRREAQAVFCAAFALLGVVLLGCFTARARRFIAGNPLAFAGVIVLLCFVLLRASTINHANELIGLELKDARWAWVLEMTGSLLIAASAAAASSSTPSRHAGPT